MRSIGGQTEPDLGSIRRKKPQRSSRHIETGILDMQTTYQSSFCLSPSRASQESTNSKCDSDSDSESESESEMESEFKLDFQ